MTPVCLRAATAADTPALVTLAQHFLAASPYGALLGSPPPGRLEALITAVLEHGTILVADQDGTLVALLALLLVPHHLTGGLYADELAWWVEPAWRHGRVGPRLLRLAEDWARQQGATMVKMVAPSDSDVGRFYTRVGYTAVETAYVKRV